MARGLSPLLLVLKRAKIEGEGGTLIRGGAGHAEAVLRNMEANLREAQAPEVTFERTSVAPGRSFILPGWVKGIIGKRRDFLVVRSGRFPRHLVVLNARDYGTLLDTSWYYLVQPVIPTMLLFGLLVALVLLWQLVSLNAAITGAILALPGLWFLRLRRGRALDVFDEMDISAYLGVAQDAAEQAIDALSREEKIESSRLLRRARGRFCRE